VYVLCHQHCERIVIQANRDHSFTRQELRDGSTKAQSRDYYYIDYRRAIDAAKYKLHVLDERIKADVAPTQEKKELQCRQCKAQWTHMEVLDCVDYLGRESGFLCKTCGHPLEEITHEGETLDSGDIPAKFNKFFGPLLKLMQQIDEVTIPAVEGQDAVAGAIEVPRDKEINPAAKHEVVTASNSRPTAVRGVASVPEKIEVSIATDSEYTEAARAKEQERQAKIAQQNQLPDWHTKSTVARDSFGNENDIKSEQNGIDLPIIKTDAEEEKKAQEANLDDVFAMIAQEQRAQEAKEAQESSSEEEDEDEFEDVVVPTTIAPPEAKRIRLESSAAPSPASGATPAASAGDGGDESDEDEFVDV
jgi:transcription initiation factor TFIIE subunit alpha